MSAFLDHLSARYVPGRPILVVVRDVNKCEVPTSVDVIKVMTKTCCEMGKVLFVTGHRE